MGRLEEVLAAVDNARRVVGRNASDLFSDPAGHLTKITDALRNTNASVAPVISNGELIKRPLSPAEQTEQTLGSLDFGGGLGVIKPKGGNWLSGQVEDALRGLRKSGPMGAKSKEELHAITGDTAAEFPANVTVLNQWIEGPLTKYIKRDMASPSDPIRALADQGILHVTPEQLPFQDRSTGLQQNRKAVGTPVEGIAQTPLGQSWENSADRFIAQAPADSYKYVPEKLQKDPWLANVPPETPIYDVMGSRGNELGFNHLVDELSNSLREGRLRPEQLRSGSFSVEAAVRHVAEVNALRAKKAEEALQADMEGMPIHKDYPEQGYSWRQLQQLGDQNAWQQQFDARKSELLAESTLKGTKWARDSLSKKIEAELGPSPYQKLEKWLKQEGDAMGHCVGGYCPDVQSGKSNIYSLRDAKGRPHVTIETAPEDAWNIAARLAPRDSPEYVRLKDALGGKVPTGVSSTELQNVLTQLYGPQATLHTIVQIKGKANAAPKTEYLPFVQDFIRSGKWSDIQDAQNTGLTPEEINQLLGR